MFAGLFLFLTLVFNSSFASTAVNSMLGSWSTGQSSQFSFPPDDPESSQVLDGTEWRLIDRVCTDGSTPRDGFWPGRDEMWMSFTDGEFLIDEDVRGCDTLSEGRYQVQGRSLFLQGVMRDCRGFERELMFQTLIDIDSDELILFFAGFGRGGSCPAGQGLMTVFEAIDRAPSKN